MHLPRPVYENLPYVYFAISGYLFVFSEGWRFIVPACIFYSAACIILVKRSAFRRMDKMKRLKKTYRLPDFLYEYMPYIYIAFAMFMLLLVRQPMLQFVSVLLIVLALRNLVCRRQHRRRSSSLF